MLAATRDPLLLDTQGVRGREREMEEMRGGRGRVFTETGLYSRLVSKVGGQPSFLLRDPFKRTHEKTWAKLEEEEDCRDIYFSIMFGQASNFIFSILFDYVYIFLLGFII